MANRRTPLSFMFLVLCALLFAWSCTANTQTPSCGWVPQFRMDICEIPHLMPTLEVTPDRAILTMKLDRPLPPQSSLDKSDGYYKRRALVIKVWTGGGDAVPGVDYLQTAREVEFVGDQVENKIEIPITPTNHNTYFIIHLSLKYGPVIMEGLCVHVPIK